MYYRPAYTCVSNAAKRKCDKQGWRITKSFVFQFVCSLSLRRGAETGASSGGVPREEKERRVWRGSVGRSVCSTWQAAA